MRACSKLCRTRGRIAQATSSEECRERERRVPARRGGSQSRFSCAPSRSPRRRWASFALMAAKAARRTCARRSVLAELGKLASQCLGRRWLQIHGLVERGLALPAALAAWKACATNCVDQPGGNRGPVVWCFGDSYASGACVCEFCNFICSGVLLGVSDV